MPKKARLFVLGLFLALVGIACVILVDPKAHAEEETEWEWGDPYPPVSGIGWDISAEGVLTVENDAGWRDYLANGPGEWIYEYDSTTERVQKLVIGKNVTTLSIYDAKQMNKDTLMETDYLLIGHAGPYQKEISIAMQDPKCMPPKIEVEQGNPVFSVVDGLLINKRKQSVVLSEIDVSNVVIPDGIKTIEAWAFYYRKLKSVTFPNTLQSIGAAAFSSCSELTRITLPDSVIKVETCAFSGCSLQSITLSKSLKTIEGFAFSSCDIQELTIPAGVSSIGFRSFHSCKLLKRVQLPEGLAKIDNYAFGDCNQLEEINLPKSLSYIGYHAFEDCTKWRIIQLPDTLTRIGGEVFYGCSPILFQLPKQLVIENTPPEKQGWCTTFEEPESTQTLGIRYVETLIVSGSRYRFGEYAAKTAEQVVFLDTPPADIHAFVMNVHSGNVSYRDAFASSWERVDEAAWSDFTLEQVTRNQVDEMVRSSIALAQKGHVPNEPSEESTGEEPYQVFEYDGWSKATDGTLTFRSNEGFIDCLQQGEFGRGGNIVIGKNVTEFQLYDMTEPVPIEGFINPADVQEDTESVFQKDESKSGYLWPWRIFLEPGNTVFLYGGGMLVNLRTMEIVTSDYTLPEHVIIPEGIRSIGNGAFLGRPIETIQLPSTLEKIGADAFRSCTYLESIDIPNSVTSIGKRAFQECTSLKTIHFSRALKSIKEDTFRESGLVEVVLPDGVRELGEDVFFRCEALQSVYLSASLKRIGPSAFEDCSQLQYVRFSDRIVSIGPRAFFWCKQLKEVVLPDSLREVGDGVFEYCRLSLLRLPRELELHAYDWDNHRFLPDVAPKKEWTMGVDSVDTVIFPGSSYALGEPGLKNVKNAYFLDAPPVHATSLLDKETTENIYCTDVLTYQWNTVHVVEWIREKMQVIQAVKMKAIDAQATRATPQPTIPPETPPPTPTPKPTLLPTVSPKPKPAAVHPKPIDPIIIALLVFILLIAAAVILLALKPWAKGKKKHKKRKKMLALPGGEPQMETPQAREEPDQHK